MVLNSRGSSLIQIVSTLAAISVVTSSLFTLTQVQSNLHGEMQLKMAAQSIRQNLVGTIANDQAWQQTRSRNAFMSCTNGGGKGGGKGGKSGTLKLRRCGRRVSSGLHCRR